MNNLYGAVMSKTTVDGRKGCKKSSGELFERRCIQATDVACVNNKGNKKWTRERKQKWDMGNTEETEEKSKSFIHQT